MKREAYTIQRSDAAAHRTPGGIIVGSLYPYALVNPQGQAIAFGMTWRTARKIADALNVAAEMRNGGHLRKFEVKP